MHLFLKILNYLFTPSPGNKIVCALYVMFRLWPTLSSINFPWFLSRKIYKIIYKAFWTQESTMYRTIFVELLTLAINALVSPIYFIKLSFTFILCFKKYLLWYMGFFPASFRPGTPTLIFLYILHFHPFSNWGEM